MSQEFGMKELYDVTLKANTHINFGNRQFEPNETIVRFDKIKIANFSELDSVYRAHGGKNDSTQIIWENTKEIQVSFTQGIFSLLQFGIMCNSKVVYKDKNNFVIVPKYIKVETDEDNMVYLKDKNIQTIFCYLSETYEKIQPLEIDKENGILKFNEPYKDICIDYTYKYTNSYTQCYIGEKHFQDYLLLEGKTRVKDDITGKVRTGIIRIPRLKLMSNLSMRLGQNASPMNANFQAIALPIKGEKEIMKIIFLEDDIDADI